MTRNSAARGGTLEPPPARGDFFRNPSNGIFVASSDAAEVSRKDEDVVLRLPKEYADYLQDEDHLSVQWLADPEGLKLLIKIDLHFTVEKLDDFAAEHRWKTTFAQKFDDGSWMRVFRDKPVTIEASSPSVTRQHILNNILVIGPPNTAKTAEQIGELMSLAKRKKLLMKIQLPSDLISIDPTAVSHTKLRNMLGLTTKHNLRPAAKVHLYKRFRSVDIDFDDLLATVRILKETHAGP